MQKFSEHAGIFEVNGSQLVSILHSPEKCYSTGILIVVGGPQTRIGSHRQFILLARFLAENGYPVMRFDYRGMGDSDGDNADFENAKADIYAALDHYFQQQAGLKNVVVWGLCDAVSAALMFAVDDPRVSKMILLNPWVRTESGKARAYLKHYYLRRLLDRTFWKKFFSGKLAIGESISSIKELLAQAGNKPNRPEQENTASDEQSNRPLPDRMARGFKRFKGDVLIILSGNNDYVADEFRELIKSSKEWKRLVQRKNVKMIDIPEANHTFSQQAWRTRVEKLTLEFLL